MSDDEGTGCPVPFHGSNDRCKKRGTRICIPHRHKHPTSFFSRHPFSKSSKQGAVTAFTTYAPRHTYETQKTDTTNSKTPQILHCSWHVCIRACLLVPACFHKVFRIKKQEENDEKCWLTEENPNQPMHWNKRCNQIAGAAFHQTHCARQPLSATPRYRPSEARASHDPKPPTTHGFTVRPRGSHGMPTAFPLTAGMLVFLINGLLWADVPCGGRPFSLLPGRAMPSSSLSFFSGPQKTGTV